MAVLRLHMPGVELNAVTPFHPPIGGQPPSGTARPITASDTRPAGVILSCRSCGFTARADGSCLERLGQSGSGGLLDWRLKAGNWCRVRRLRRRSRRRGNGWIGSLGQTSGTPRLAGPGSGSTSCSSIRFANIAWSAPSSRQRRSAITSSHITATSNKFWLGTLPVALQAMS